MSSSFETCLALVVIRFKPAPGLELKDDRQNVRAVATTIIGSLGGGGLIVSGYRCHPFLGNNVQVGRSFSTTHKFVREQRLPRVTDC
jgi:hypothetical protein